MLVLISNPALCVTLESAKKYINVEGEGDNEMITSLLEATTKNAEDKLNRQLGAANYSLTIESLCDGFKLPKNPIQSIEKIELLDANGDYNLVDSSKYYLYEELELGKIKLLEKLETINHKQAVRITFKCGYVKLPKPIEMWIKYKTMCLFDGREENINKYIDNMISSYRLGPLG